MADIQVASLDGLSTLSHVQSYRPSVDASVISGYADAEQAELLSTAPMRVSWPDLL